MAFPYFFYNSVFNFPPFLKKFSSIDSIFCFKAYFKACFELLRNLEKTLPLRQNQITKLLSIDKGAPKKSCKFGRPCFWFVIFLQLFSINFLTIFITSNFGYIYKYKDSDVHTWGFWIALKKIPEGLGFTNFESYVYFLSLSQIAFVGFCHQDWVAV